MGISFAFQKTADAPGNACCGDRRRRDRATDLPSWSYIMMQEGPSPLDNQEKLLEEAESLTWALLDDQLDAADAARLARLLEENDAARTRYIECVQLHVDLKDHYAPPATAGAGEKLKGVPILPNLLPGGLPGAESLPPVIE
jgi:hypothetical protein